MLSSDYDSYPSWSMIPSDTFVFGVRRSPATVAGTNASQAMQCRYRTAAINNCEDFMSGLVNIRMSEYTKSTLC